MIDRLVGREGGYANHPADKGGETMWGITIAVARAFGYMGPMKSMPRSEAVRIYKARYWTQPGFDRVFQLSPAIAEEMFDTGVNMGTVWPVRFLQRALNVLNMQASIYPDIAVDGVLGAMTIAAMKAYGNKRGAEAEPTLLAMLNAQQSVRYMELAEKEPSQESFEHGWQYGRVVQ